MGILRALRLLRQHFGGRGVDGLVLQGQLKGEQVGKIIFATRTIGQVKQLAGELRLC